MENTLKSCAPFTCPIVRSARLIGDEWILLVLRALFRGPQRFDDLQSLTGAATNILTGRLKRLIDAGVVAKTPYQERPVRYKYALTDSGLGLFPVVLELMRYGNEWLPTKEAPPLRLRHLDCGKLSWPGQTCTECGKPLTLKNVRLEDTAPDDNPSSG